MAHTDVLWTWERYLGDQVTDVGQDPAGGQVDFPMCRFDQLLVQTQILHCTLSSYTQLIQITDTHTAKNKLLVFMSKSSLQLKFALKSIFSHPNTFSTLLTYLSMQHKVVYLLSHKIQLSVLWKSYCYLLTYIINVTQNYHLFYCLRLVTWWADPRPAACDWGLL